MHQVHPNAPATVRRLTLAIALALPAFGSPLSALADDTATQNMANPQSGARNFKIPAQPLADALNAFIAASDWQVGFPAGLAQDVKSSAVNGSYTPQQALQQLLVGSGLSYRATGTNTVTLEKAQEQLNKTDPTTLKPMTVKGNRGYDQNDPYNKNYAVPNASTATKTDIAIMDTPVSIQVVPKSVMNDQQDIRIEDALTRNVSGVQREYVTANMYESFIIRGFGNNDKVYRNGARRFMG
ncbi:MAG: secretin and TonB N-terminal domain-containing protein, partial [Methylococcaceae bacterium]